jgi:hypothetical protein
VGFQKKNGANPHFRKKQKIMITQVSDSAKRDFKFSELSKYINIDSVKNQSKVRTLW